VKPSAAALVRTPRTLVIAHRGDSRAAPENTLAAFASALSLGVDLVELDYLHTADGVPVVFHDDELDRLTDAPARWGKKKIALASKSLAELKQLDAGGWFAPQFAGTRIATLEEALLAVCPTSAMMIERKAGDAGTCVGLLQRLGFLDRVAVTAFDWQFLADCHALAPDLVLGALGTKELSPDQLDEAVRIGASVIGWDDAHVTGELVEQVHRRGLRLWIWTVDDVDRARQLVSWGADALITNVPSAMQTVVGEE
jgi:glycerophosphoryl diester phosphodiesterase